MSLDDIDLMVIKELVDRAQPNVEAQRLHDRCLREITVLMRDIKQKRAELAFDLHEVEKREEIIRRTRWARGEGQ